MSRPSVEDIMRALRMVDVSVNGLRAPWGDEPKAWKDFWELQASAVLALFEPETVTTAAAKADILRREADQFGSGYWPDRIRREDVQVRLRARARQVEEEGRG